MVPEGEVAIPLSAPRQSTVRRTSTRYDAFAVAHAQAAELFEESKRSTYQRLKLEGILESPLGICITCDRERTGPVVLGRTHMKTMDLYSCVCAVQNLWLAARAEGVGVGWVSIFNEVDLQQALGIPSNIIPIAYLCVGYVSHFYAKPELETKGWLPRLDIKDLVYFDEWGKNNHQHPLMAHLDRDRLHAESVRIEDASNIAGLESTSPPAEP